MGTNDSGWNSTCIKKQYCPYSCFTRATHFHHISPAPLWFWRRRISQANSDYVNHNCHYFLSFGYFYIYMEKVLVQMISDENLVPIISSLKWLSENECFDILVVISDVYKLNGQDYCLTDDMEHVSVLTHNDLRFIKLRDLHHLCNLLRVLDKVMDLKQKDTDEVTWLEVTVAWAHDSVWDGGWFTYLPTKVCYSSSSSPGLMKHELTHLTSLFIFCIFQQALYQWFNYGFAILQFAYTMTIQIFYICILK